MHNLLMLEMTIDIEVIARLETSMSMDMTNFTCTLDILDEKKGQSVIRFKCNALMMNDNGNYT